MNEAGRDLERVGIDPLTVDALTPKRAAILPDAQAAICYPCSVGPVRPVRDAKGYLLHRRFDSL